MGKAIDQFMQKRTLKQRTAPRPPKLIPSRRFNSKFPGFDERKYKQIARVCFAMEIAEKHAFYDLCRKNGEYATDVFQRAIKEYLQRGPRETR